MEEIESIICSINEKVIEIKVGTPLWVAIYNDPKVTKQLFDLLEQGLLKK